VNLVLSIEEVAELLHIAPQTARNRLAKGEPMPPSFKAGRRRLFLSSVVLEWLQQQPGATIPKSAPELPSTRPGRKRNTEPGQMA
jgi:predicted DNA-binding transcriptional regulator AlpA